MCGTNRMDTVDTSRASSTYFFKRWENLRRLYVEHQLTARLFVLHAEIFPPAHATPLCATF